MSSKTSTNRLHTSKPHPDRTSVENLTCDSAQHTAIITVVADGVAFHQGTRSSKGT
jgi:hypothetical protein